MTRCRIRFVLLATAVALVGSVGRADSIYLYNPDGSPPMKPFRENVVVLRIQGDALVFRTGSGNEQEIALEKVARLTVSSDAVLSDADDAYILRDYDKAVDGYLRAIRSSEPWKIRWVAPRLTKAAAKTNRFDASMAAYLASARIDPPSAIDRKPSLPPKGSKLLDEAVKQLDTELRTSTSEGEKQALLSLLLDVQLRRGDQVAAESVASQLSALGGANADPKLAGMMVGIRLDQAAAEIDAGRFERVQELLAPIRSRIMEPNQQALAMFLLAQAARGVAGQDEAAQLDAAIAFMRVAAHFGLIEGRPFVAESLLEAANINQAVGDTASAGQLYQQLEAEFAGTAFASEAARRRSELTR